jgi:hypothetical protein
MLGQLCNLPCVSTSNDGACACEMLVVKVTDGRHRLASSADAPVLPCECKNSPCAPASRNGEGSVWHVTERCKSQQPLSVCAYERGTSMEVCDSLRPACGVSFLSRDTLLFPESEPWDEHASPAPSATSWSRTRPAGLALCLHERLGLRSKGWLLLHGTHAWLVAASS